MGTVDQAFLKAGKSAGLEIWRIEKLKVVLQDQHTYGEFYSGDSYIVLHTKKNAHSGKFEWDIHFWLGNETSQDEKGVAAYKTVELDDYLGGAPVQHREVQDHESKLFLSYFPKGIRYLTGGIESGFRKVDKNNFVKRLFQIKGKKNVRVKQVECACSSLNQGDVFLLDCGMTLHLWNGPQSSTFERMKGQQVTKTIRDEERGGKANIRIIDQRWNSDIKFFADLGSKSDIAESATAGDDVEFEKKMITDIKLYRVSNASGKMTIEEKSKKPLTQNDLDSNDCFILDAGSSGIFVWVGRKCTDEEKKSAWNYATGFLDMKGYPLWTSITRLVEGGETPVFKQFFMSWMNESDQKGLGDIHNVGSIVAIKHQQPIDYCKLHERKSSVEEDDVTMEVEEIKLWKIENGDTASMTVHGYTILSSTSCYIILASLRLNNKPVVYGYYWQGACSTKDDKTASAIYAKRYCDEISGRPTQQIRVDQGKEPTTLMRILGGKLIVTLDDDSLTDDNQLYHIRGSTLENTKAIQVDFSASSLNSYDVFLVMSSSTVFIWIGIFSVDAELQSAMNLAEYLDPGCKILKVYEESEPENFWKLLGGKKTYAKMAKSKTGNAHEQSTVRLFSCSNTTGMFKVTEIVNFTQEDLLEDDVMLLDTFGEIYVWVGKGANRLERQKSLQAAINYLNSDPFGRTEKNTKLTQIKQGYEPPTFTSHFHGWDHSRWRSSIYKRDSVENLLSPDTVTTVQEELKKFDQNYTYDQLLQKRLPDGVDPTYKEKYLSDGEFVQVFGMSREVFDSKPKWKQLELKKKVGLF